MYLFDKIWLSSTSLEDHGGQTWNEQCRRFKLTFFRGASLEDPKQLFNSSLEGNIRRAIDIREGEKLNKTAFKALIKTAVKANSAAKASKAKGKK